MHAVERVKKHELKRFQVVDDAKDTKIKTSTFLLLFVLSTRVVHEQKAGPLQDCFARSECGNGSFELG